MAKKIWEIKDFKGGLNAYADARDIDDNQFSQNWNVVVDRTGVLRVTGCAITDIDASMVDNSGFETGFGLFQFSSDYLFNDGFETGFDSGITQGTIKEVTSTTVFTLEDTPSLSTTNNYYNGMTIFFYSATNVPGHSRPITGYTYSGGNGVITVAPAFDANITEDDKYIIYRWGSTNFSSSATATDDIDWITDGISTGHYASEATGLNFSDGEDSSNQFFTVSKITSTDHTVVDGGYLEYKGGSGTNLTLRSGVEYTLSFYCAAKEPWFNMVSDGAVDGSSSISERVPWIELYSATVTNGAQNTGLYLQSNGHWLKKSFQTNYITNTEANYISDGDFENGGGDWSTSGTITKTINATASVYDTYGGEGKTCHLSNNGDLGNPEGYIYQSLTLYTGVKYHLNFVYYGNLQYAVYQGSDVIIPWTNSGTPYSKVEDANTGNSHKAWRYPNYKYNDETQSYESNYISFIVNEALGSATDTIQIRFAKYIDGSGGWSDGHPVQLDGISVTRAQNDLVTMSVNSNAHSPLTTTSPVGDVFSSLSNTAYGDITEWSRYITTFKIPSDYNNATDWILRIHAGKWGWQDGASQDYSASGTATVATQEVYIDNINLTSYGNEGRDVITLLQKNVAASASTSKSGEIVINSSSLGNESWFGGFLKFEEGGIKPSINYNNGILRISDGNFANDNENIMMYYDKYNESSDRNWKSRRNFIQRPPNFDFSTTSDTVINTDLDYSAIHHINELCNLVTYRAPVDHTGAIVDGGVETFWRYDQFGENADIGIITRHMVDKDRTINQNMEYLSDGHIPSFDTKDESDPANKLHAASGGYSQVTEIETGEGHSETFGDEFGCVFTGGYVADWYSAALTPLIIPIKLKGDSSDSFEENTAYDYIYNEGANEYITKVNEVEFNLTYNMRSQNNANHIHTDNHNAYSDPSKPFKNYPVPKFQIRIVSTTNGVSNGSIGQMLTENVDSFPVIQDGDSIIYESWYGADARTSGFTVSEVYNGEKSYGDGILIESFVQNYGDTNEIADLKINIHDTIQFQDYSTAPELENHSIIIYVRDRFGSEHNAISGCLDNPFWAVGTSPNSEIQEGTQSAVFFSNELSTENEFGNVNKTSYWTRYFINDIRLRFYDDNAQSSENIENINITSDIIGGNSAYLNLAFKETSEVDVIGWMSRHFHFAISSVNIFDEESSLNILDKTIGTFNIGECPDLNAYISHDLLNDKFIKKTKIYMKSTDTDIWYLQWYIDHKEDNGTLYSSTSGGKAIKTLDETGMYRFVLSKENNNIFNEVNSYESETFIKQEDGEKHENLTCRYKTSLVANNTMYVGNIKQAGNIYEDKMIKSPINKFGILPASNQINVAINDGDEITALAFYKDRLLQFKRQKVFVINTSGDYEFLEDTLYNVGVHGQFSVANTPYGIIWANENGFYLYDGQKLINLIENKIPVSEEVFGLANNKWCASSTTGDCVVGYSTKRDVALINFTRESKGPAATPTGASYHFPTKSWTLLFMVWNNDSADTTTGNMSNMITNSDGDISFYHTSQVAGNITDGINTIRKWEHDAVNTVHSTKLVYFSTKDITFGDINVRKKIYRVYITYRVLTDGTDSGMVVKAAVNGSGSGASGSFSIDFSQTSKFAFGESNSSGTLCYAGGSLDETDGKWKTAELKFDTPSEVNNITSLQLQFLGTVPYNFEINDISISYRTKNVK